MKFGLASVNSNSGSHPETLASLARAAEREGFDSVWAGGHPFLSETQTRIPPTTRMLDPIVALSFVAGQTQKIRLGTGVLLLPQFNPVIAARQLASLDVLSNGRLTVGIGVGWSEHEYEVLGLSFKDRGRRTDDYIKAMRALWSQEKPEYRGRYVSFDRLQANPRPLQQPGPPIVIGGTSEGAFRRAVEMGNGWFGFGMDVEGAKRAMMGLREAAARYERPSALGELEITVAPSIPLDAAAVGRFADLGVQRLNLIVPANADASSAVKFVETMASALRVGKR